MGADDPLAVVENRARVLMVDYVGLEGMVRAAGIARAAGIPVVADLEQGAGWLFADLFSLAGPPDPAHGVHTV